jgi:hypothetical protein
MSRSKSKKSSIDITVSLDFGGSGSKIIYESIDGGVASLFMEPELAAITQLSIANTQNKLGATDPENACWIQCKAGYFAVGYLARSRYRGNAGLHELKYERAVYKTLGAIWAIKERLKLSASLQVALAILLPPGEYENASRFEQLVRSALLDYQTPTGRMNVELACFRCFPEGAGIYLRYFNACGDALKQKVSCFAMIGYRNSSVLIQDRGAVEGGISSDLGFVRMVEKVVAHSSGQSVERLTPAIVASGVNIEPAPLLKLARSTTKEGRVSEVQSMVTAIKTARYEYAASLIGWLDSVIPTDADELVFCGGTAEYIKNELRDRYLGKTVSWNAGMGIPAELDTWGLGDRLCDVYGVFLCLSDEVKRLTKKNAVVLGAEVSRG